MDAISDQLVKPEDKNPIVVETTNSKIQESIKTDTSIIDKDKVK